MSWLDVVKGVASVLGVVAFVWSLWSVFNGYLHVCIKSVELKKGYLLIATRAENRSVLSKNLDFAFLLVGPVDAEPSAVLAAMADRARCRDIPRIPGPEGENQD